MSIIKRVLGPLRGPAGVYLGALVLSRLGAFLLIPLYTRKLSLEQYGNLNLAQTLVTLLSATFALTLVSAVTRVYFEDADPERAARQSGSVARWISVIAMAWGLVAAGLVVILAPRQGTITSLSFLLGVVIASAFGAIAPVPSYYLRARQRAYLASSWQLLDFVLSIVLGLWLVLGLRMGFQGAFLALVISQTVPGVLATVFIWTSMRGSLDRAVLARAVAFAFPFLLQVYANWVLASADRWALKFAAYHRDVGIYALAAQLTQIAVMPVAAFGDAELARLGEVYRSGGIRAVFAQLGPVRKRFAILSALPSACLIVGLPLLPWVLGPHVRPALPIIPILSVIALIESQFLPYQQIVYFASRSRYIAWVAIASVLVELALVFVLTKPWGITGAVIAKASATTARTVGMWLAARRCMRGA